MWVNWRAPTKLVHVDSLQIVSREWNNMSDNLINSLSTVVWYAIHTYTHTYTVGVRHKAKNKLLVILAHFFGPHHGAKESVYVCVNKLIILSIKRQSFAIKEHSFTSTRRKGNTLRKIMCENCTIQCWNVWMDGFFWQRMNNFSLVHFHPSRKSTLKKRWGVYISSFHCVPVPPLLPSLVFECEKLFHAFLRSVINYGENLSSSLR